MPAGRPRKAPQDRVHADTQSESHYDAQDARKLLAFPTLREIPEPSVPLTGHALAFYQRWVKQLFETHRLTLFTQDRLEGAAMLQMAIMEKMDAGKAPAANAVRGRDQIMKELGLASDRTIAAPKEAGGTRYSNAGFAHGRARIRD